jgi:hypothetical protein|tara:strand:- start:590 stop:988 length:399 start_codon:yes stop_codon:yes gene_type:complete
MTDPAVPLVMVRVLAARLDVLQAALDEVQAQAVSLRQALDGYPVAVPDDGAVGRHEMLAMRRAAELGYTLAQLQGRSRRQALVAARDDIATLLHDDGATAVAIGRILHRDHSTILSALERWRRRHEAPQHRP